MPRVISRYIFSILPVFLFARIARAADGAGSVGDISDAEGQGGVLHNPLAGSNINSLDDLLAALLNVLMQIGVVVLVVMLVYTGFLFITAQGNPEGLSKAKSALLWTVIGGAVVLGAGVIAGAIKSTVGAL